jgi:predicted TPR repeat methyltransferase
LNIKRPLFSHNDNFNTEVFSEKFDFIVAQSILTHAGPDLVMTFLNSSLNALKDGGLLLFSYLNHKDNEGALPQDGWHYPHCISYSEQYIMDRLVESGLHGRALKWHHPGANWIVASLSVVNIPESMCF